MPVTISGTVQQAKKGCGKLSNLRRATRPVITTAALPPAMQAARPPDSLVRSGVGRDSDKFTSVAEFVRLRRQPDILAGY